MGMARGMAGRKGGRFQMPFLVQVRIPKTKCGPRRRQKESLSNMREGWGVGRGGAKGRWVLLGAAQPRREQRGRRGGTGPAVNIVGGFELKSPTG